MTRPLNLVWIVQLLVATAAIAIAGSLLSAAASAEALTLNARAPQVPSSDQTGVSSEGCRHPRS